MKSTALEIATILKLDRNTLSDSTCQITELSIDSRHIYHSANTLFIALDGNKTKGVDYVEELYKLGVRNFLIEKKYRGRFEKLLANFFYVDNPTKALQQIVAFKRDEYNLEVIGITGSNGKTIVKEWLSQLLRSSFRICKNPKSYNSQIGVPLSVWGIEDFHNLGLFEAGISKSNEMVSLERVIKPTIGVLTNLGDAHQINFISIEEKLEEKLRLFIHSKQLITSSVLVEKFRTSFDRLLKQNPTLEIITWGNTAQSKILITVDENDKNLSIQYSNTTYRIPLKNMDKSYVENLSLCLSVISVLTGNIEPYIAKIEQLSSLEMRLEVLEGIYNTTLINDTYNADVESLTIAIQYLFQNKSTSPKSIILSEIVDANKQPVDKTIELLNHKKLHQLILIGKAYENYLPSFRELNIERVAYYETTADFIDKHSLTSFKGDIILLKGARKFRLEDIVKKLRSKTHSTYLKVHLNALKNNLNVFANRLDAKTKIMVMLKADGYGLGSLELAKILESQRVDYFAVAYTDEGIELRQAGIIKPIVVLNPEVDAFDKLVEFRLEPEIYSLSILKKLLAWLNKNTIQQSIKVHLKLETGMHRLGIPSSDIQELINLLTAYPQIDVSSILSHLAASDEAAYDSFTKQQIETFIAEAAQIEKALHIQPHKHILNTGGIIRHTMYQMNMVRLGIGLFGFDSTGIVQVQLQNTITLVAKISQIKTVMQGETVGYSRRGVAQRDSKIAIINIGYADGYFRSFGNGLAKVFIKNQYAPTIGNVCMDMIMADITDCQNIEEGDEVELLGEHISIAELAQKTNTIPYEIITAISKRVQRIYWED